MLKADWIDFQREPQCPPDPRWPHGKLIDMRDGMNVKCCKIGLPCPAKRCGMWVIHCEKCHLKIGVTTAGRPDDPAVVVVPCKLTNGHSNGAAS